MKTVLEKAVRENIQTDPYAYIVIEDAIDASLADELLTSYPPVETIIEGKNQRNNKRFSYSASKVRADDSIPDIWKDFINAHVSQIFLDQVVSLFENQIKGTHPDFEDRFGKLNSLRAGIRKEDDFSKADVLLDAQICINTPVVTDAVSVRGPHVDIYNKIFGGLLYLRHPDDSSEGGNLQVYRWKDTPQFFDEQYAPSHLVEFVAEVPYKHNTLVVFINSQNALHGVTPRGKTAFPRLFMNIIGEVNAPLFNPREFKGRTSKKFFKNASKKLFS